MHFVVTVGVCSIVSSGKKNDMGQTIMVDGPERGTTDVLVEAPDAEAAKKSMQRFEHIMTYWTECLTTVKSVRVATQEDINSSMTRISFFEKYWYDRAKIS